jgi:hypothetical protein
VRPFLAGSEFVQRRFEGTHLRPQEAVEIVRIARGTQRALLPRFSETDRR